MNGMLVREDIQGYNLQDHLQAAANKAAEHGSTVGTVKVKVEDLRMIEKPGYAAVMYCHINNLQVVEGQLPAVIEEVTLGENVTWAKGYGSTKAILTIEVNGTSKVVAIEPEVAMA